MPEQIPTYSENKKKPGEISQKTRKLIQAFSLSVGLVMGGNALAGDTKTTGLPVDYKQTLSEDSGIHNELQYLFTEKHEGLVMAISQKLRDEGKMQESLGNDLQFFQKRIVALFQKSILKNGTTLDYNLTPEIIGLFGPIKEQLLAFFDLRYEKGKYNIFDGKDYSKTKLKIIFRKVEEEYIIESIYIISPEKEEVGKKTEAFYRSVV